MTIELPQVYQIGENEARNFAVDLKSELDSGELLTGTPTVTEETTGDLTIGNKAVNTSTIVINGRSAVAGEAVQFNVSGQQDGTAYRLLISVGTDATPAQTIQLIARFCCE